MPRHDGWDDYRGASYHSAEVYKIDCAGAAWAAVICQEDENDQYSAWTNEAAAKMWVRRLLASQFGIHRDRLPWQVSKPSGYHKRLTLEWMDDENQEFLRWI